VSQSNWEMRELKIITCNTLNTLGFFHDKNGGTGYADIIKSTPHGRVSFGHCEVRGYQHWGPAAAEGSRAVDQVYNYL